MHGDLRFTSRRGQETRAERERPAMSATHAERLSDILATGRNRPYTGPGNDLGARNLTLIMEHVA